MDSTLIINKELEKFRLNFSKFADEDVVSLR